MTEKKVRQLVDLYRKLMENFPAESPLLNNAEREILDKLPEIIMEENKKSRGNG